MYYNMLYLWLNQIYGISPPVKIILKTHKRPHIVFLISYLTLLTINQGFSQNYSLVFDGNDDYVEVINSSLFNFGTNDFSLECWFKTEDVLTGHFANAISKVGGTNHYYDITPQDNNCSFPYHPSFHFANGDAQDFYACATTDVDDGLWHHLCGVRESDTISIYVDGVLEGQTTIPGSANANNSGPLHFEPRNSQFPVVNYMDEVRIWDRALTIQEIQTNMCNPPLSSSPGLVGMWCFNEGSGTVAIDSSQYQNNGTLYGPTWSADVPQCQLQIVSVTATPDTICDGDSSQLNVEVQNGTGTLTYQWTSNPSGFTSSINNPIVTPNTSTWYIISVSDNDTTLTDSTFVTVNSSPSVDLGDDTLSYCNVDSILLDAGIGFANYLWNTGDTTQSIYVAQSGLYSVIVTNNFGCSATDTVLLDILNIGIIPGDTLICSGDDLVLSVSLNSTYEILIEEFTFIMTQYNYHSSPVLDSGKNYLLKVTGTYGISGGIQDQYDGAYRLKNGSTPIIPFFERLWSWNGLYSQQPIPFQYNEDHIYNFYFTSSGGSEVFEYTDDPYYDNTGSLTYQIWQESSTVSYLWSTGDTTQSITISPTLTTQYWVEVSDSLISCFDTITVTVGQVIAQISGDTIICEYDTTTLVSSGGTQYLWSTGSSEDTIQLFQAGNIWVRVTDSVGCIDTAFTSIQVNPRPTPTISGEDTICFTELNSIYSTESGMSNYTWNISTGGTIIYGQNSDTIIVTWDSLGSQSISVNYSNQYNCPSLSETTLPVTVFPSPEVNYIPCISLTSRDARSFVLRGAIPLNGIYSGTGVQGGIFNPGLVPFGQDTVVINYYYINTFGCADSASAIIFVLPSSNHTCGNPFTDVRDNQVYETFFFGTTCWMTENLNYGMHIPSSEYQRDNCIPEKFCYNEATANCNSFGGLYQWDELMEYSASDTVQGLCPPGWHIPTMADWDELIQIFQDEAHAGTPLKSTGLSGFNGLLNGFLVNPSVYKYGANDTILTSTLFWTSTGSGQGKSLAHGMNTVVEEEDFTTSVSTYSSLRVNAFAVRCVKDK